MITQHIEGKYTSSEQALDALQQPPVVFFTNSMVMGGMEEHMAILAEGLVRRGTRMAVICPADDAIAPFRERLVRAGIDVYPLSQKRSVTALARRVRDLVSIMRRYRPFVLHMHITGSDGGTLPMLAARIAGCKAMVRTEHLSPDETTSLRQRLLIRGRDRFLSAVICVSQANLEMHVRHVSRERGKFVVIPNCTHPDVFDPNRVDGAWVREHAGVAPDALLVGVLGRLDEPRKGVTHFIQAARMLAARHNDYRFVVIGEGAMHPALEAEGRDCVTFTGAMRAGNAGGEGDAEVAAACYASMDIMVMPSLAEGGPITVLEAMAMRRPVVATDVGMVREVIADDSFGLVVPPGDAAALATAIERLAANPDLRSAMGCRARERIVERYTPDAMIDATARLYQRLCATEGAPALA